jgi:hypothetical protein
MGSPAQPVDPIELQRALAALSRALEPEGLPADGLRLSQREAALAEASRLQGLVDGLASRLSPQPPEPKLDPPPSGPNAGRGSPHSPLVASFGIGMRPPLGVSVVWPSLRRS